MSVGAKHQCLVQLEIGRTEKCKSVELIDQLRLVRKINQRPDKVSRCVEVSHKVKNLFLIWGGGWIDTKSVA